MLEDPSLETLLAGARGDFDLTRADDQRSVSLLAEALEGFSEDEIRSPSVYDFSFDTDWILAALAAGEPIEQVPFAFIDSFAESASITQGPMTTWETLLFGLCIAVKRHGFAEGPAAEMISVINDEIKGHEDLDRIINLIPKELEGASDSDFGNPDVMSPASLRTWLREVLNPSHP